MDFLQVYALTLHLICIHICMYTIMSSSGLVMGGKRFGFSANVPSTLNFLKKYVYMFGARDSE